MKWLSDRISFHRHGEYTTILISSKVEKWKEGLLFGWLILWSLVGISIFYILFSGRYAEIATAKTPESRLQLYLILFLVFWLYYMYKIIKVYLWRKKGVEYIKISDSDMLIKRAFGKIGAAHAYKFENMGEIDLLQQPERSFSKVMQSAFWDIGNEALGFEYHGKTIIFGIQLEQNEAKKLKEFLIGEIKKRSKKE